MPPIAPSAPRPSADALDKALDNVLAPKAEPKSNRSIKRATIAEQVKIANVMTPVLKPHASLAGLFQYDEGWSDERVLKEALPGVDLGVNSVISVRQSMFGKLAPAGGASPSSLVARVAELETQMAALTALVMELKK